MKTQESNVSIAERFELVRKYIEEFIAKSSEDEFETEKNIMSELNNGKGTHGKFTQEAFAKALDVSVQTIRNYEAGRRLVPSDILLTISQKYGIRLDYLLGNDDSMVEDRRHSIREFTTDELLAELKRRIEAP